MWRRASSALAIAVLAMLGACSGGGGAGGTAACTPSCGAAQSFLTEADVQRIVAQAVGEGNARGVPVIVSVVDRVGNPLVTFATFQTANTDTISSGLGVTGGLEGALVSPYFVAYAKALTGTYLSSNGNAFSTRTAGQIIQEHFNPNEAQQPSGPLYGVQFSQLPCSDVNTRQGTVGPKPSPIGLSADPGGLPLYKNGELVGGIGVAVDGLYGFDRDITNLDENVEELIAVAGSTGFAAPADIRADRITADGRTLRYVDSEAIKSDPSRPPGPLAALGFFPEFPGTLTNGTRFGTGPSGVRPDSGAFSPVGGWVLVDATNTNRYPPRAAADGSVGAADSQALLSQALALAQRARGQIRRPLGSSAQVSIAVVDRNGDILGVVRTSDAPVFGIDVSVQKARTALFFSHPDAAAELAAAPPAQYVNGTTASIAAYATAFRDFTGTGLDGAIAWTPRAIGNLHRPFYPDGIRNTPPGPLSTPHSNWSPFNPGFQLDLVYNGLLRGLSTEIEGCAGRVLDRPFAFFPDPQIGKLRNGAQIFPGGVPIYRGGTLVGAIGVSGDGVDQDDMIAYLAVENVARAGSALANAPRNRRADTLAPLGLRPRYVQCPQSPFNGSTEQNVCE